MDKNKAQCDNYQNLRRAVEGSFQSIYIKEKVDTLHRCLEICGTVKPECLDDYHGKQDENQFSKDM